MATTPLGRGTLLAHRFTLRDLLDETEGARFWRAYDEVLARDVAVHVLAADDPRAEAVLSGARASATVADGHLLRVLDAASTDGVTYVVQEWGSGMSLDKLLQEGPLSARRAAWVVKEVAEAIAVAHRHGIAHGRLVPENVVISDSGSVKLIGFVVDAVLRGGERSQPAGQPRPTGQETDVADLAALLYAGLTARWPGTHGSRVPAAPTEHGRCLRPRQVRAGIPRPLDAICERALNPEEGAPPVTAQGIYVDLSDYIGEGITAVPLGVEATAAIPAVAYTEPAALTADPDADPDADPEATQAAPRGPSDFETTRTVTLSSPTPGTAPEPDQPDDEADQADRPDRPDRPDQAYRPDADEGADEGADEEDEEATAQWSPWTTAAAAGTDQDSRPLFAPEPRRSPAAAGAPAGGAGPAAAAGTSSGTVGHPGPATGGLPAVWGPDADGRGDTGELPARDTPPGRGWLRLGLVVGSLLVLTVAVVLAFNLGRGNPLPLGEEETPSATPSPSRSAPPAPEAVAVRSVTDFDPVGDGEENADQAPLAIDGDPATAWSTVTYFDPLEAQKDGVGLLLDLGRRTPVRDATVTFSGGPTSAELLAAPGSVAPATAEGLREVDAVAGAGDRARFAAGDPVRARFLVLWLTKLPPSGNGYVGQVAEVVVRS